MHWTETKVLSKTFTFCPEPLGPGVALTFPSSPVPTPSCPAYTTLNHTPSCPAHGTPLSPSFTSEQRGLAQASCPAPPQPPAQTTWPR